MAKFEGQERRAAKIAACLETLGMKEIEEARAQINALEQHFGYAWDAVKHDANAKSRIERCKDFAVWAACELIQVAAMCQKFQKLEGKK